MSVCAVIVALVMGQGQPAVDTELSLLDECPTVQPLACAFKHLGSYQDSMHIVCFGPGLEPNSVDIVYRGRAVILRGI
jgi:hypothetical protein